MFQLPQKNCVETQSNCVIPLTSSDIQNAFAAKQDAKYYKAMYTKEVRASESYAKVTVKLSFPRLVLYTMLIFQI